MTAFADRTKSDRKDCSRACWRNQGLLADVGDRPPRPCVCHHRRGGKAPRPRGHAIRANARGNPPRPDAGDAVSWLDALRARRTADRDLADEIQEHLQEKIDTLVADGVPPDVAAARARREFGNVTLITEQSRDVWRWRLADDARFDVRYAVRQLRRSPSFTLAALATLALGIGANTAIFSMADRALLNPLPVPHPDRLVTINEIVPLIANRPIRLTAPDLLDYQRQNHTFEGVGGWRARTFELSGGRESERVQAVRATAAFFSVLEVPPALGRSFTPEEDDEAAAVCVISDGLWQRWFGADRHRSARPFISIAFHIE